MLSNASSRDAAIDRAILPFAPLLYLAWTDGALDEQEIAHIAAVIRDQHWIEPSARAALAHWLNPLDPPSAADLQSLLATMRKVGRALPDYTWLSEITQVSAEPTTIRLVGQAGNNFALNTALLFLAVGGAAFALFALAKVALGGAA